MDEKNDWGFHRAPGLGEIQSGDVILFHAKDDDKTVLVKRIANIVYENGEKCYYVLGDNANNSTDSRHFGLVRHHRKLGRRLHAVGKAGMHMQVNAHTVR